MCWSCIRTILIFLRFWTRWPYALLLLFSCQVVCDSLLPCGPRHGRPPCPSPSPGVCPSPWSTASVMPSSHLSPSSPSAFDLSNSVHCSLRLNSQKGVPCWAGRRMPLWEVVWEGLAPFRQWTGVRSLMDLCSSHRALRSSGITFSLCFTFLFGFSPQRSLVQYWAWLILRFSDLMFYHIFEADRMWWGTECYDMSRNIRTDFRNILLSLREFELKYTPNSNLSKISNIYWIYRHIYRFSYHVSI